MTTIIWFSPLSTGCPDLFWKLSRWPDPQSRPSVKMFETSWSLLPLTNHLKDTESSKDGHSMCSHIARSAAPSSVDTKDSVTDVSENSVAFAIWDHWKVANLEKRKNDTKQKNLLQFWRNASRGIASLPPACYAHLVEYKLVQDLLIYKVKDSELVVDGSQLLLLGSELPIWSFSPCRLGPQLLQGLEDKLKSKKNRYLLWICKKKNVNSEVGKCKCLKGSPGEM